MEKQDRQCTVEVVRKLNSSFRWFLSGTPKHSGFGDIRDLAGYLGVHLGIDEPPPGKKYNARFLEKGEKTGFERLSKFMEARSRQWHERRHGLAQSFLGRFVRQNVAEM